MLHIHNSGLLHGRSLRERLPNGRWPISSSINSRLSWVKIPSASLTMLKTKRQKWFVHVLTCTSGDCTFTHLSTHLSLNPSNEVLAWSKRTFANMIVLQLQQILWLWFSERFIHIRSLESVVCQIRPCFIAQLCFHSLLLFIDVVFCFVL